MAISFLLQPTHFKREPFIIGFNLFFGLYYTGNSGVSNYSLVKEEITRYLPIALASFLLALISLIIKGFQA